MDLLSSLQPQYKPLAVDHVPRVRMVARRCTQATVLEISGEVDVANCEEVQDVVISLALGDDPLILDMSGIDFFGVRGISVLMAVRETRRAIDATWALVPSRVVSRVLQLTAFDTEFSSAVSARDALRLVMEAERHS